jgi:hypothetical protein
MADHTDIFSVVFIVFSYRCISIEQSEKSRHINNEKPIVKAKSRSHFREAGF